MTDHDRLPAETPVRTDQPAASQVAATPPELGATLDPALQAHIGRQLRALYDEVIEQPVPDRFVQLLEELERKKAGGA